MPGRAKQCTHRLRAVHRRVSGFRVRFGGVAPLGNPQIRRFVDACESVHGTTGAAHPASPVLGNVGSLVCFRVGAEDAEELRKELHPVTAESLTDLNRFEACCRVMRRGQPSEPAMVKTLPPSGFGMPGATTLSISRCGGSAPPATRWKESCAAISTTARQRVWLSASAQHTQKGLAKNPALVRP